VVSPAAIWYLLLRDSLPPDLPIEGEE
jgi:hypothetical protein